MPVSVIQNHRPGDKSRDWEEDFAHENGCYMCACFSCNRLFYGHKRRVECKDCATTQLETGK